MFKLGFILSAFGILFNSSLSLGQTLSLKEYIHLAEKNDPEFKAIFIDKEKLSHLVDQGLPSREMTLSASGEYGISTSGGTPSTAITAKAKKDVIETGTSASLSHTLANQPDRTEGVTSFLIEQSLYKNFFGRDVRLKKGSLRKEEEILRLQVLENYESYLLTIITKYLDFQKATLDASLAKKAYKKTAELNKNMLAKKRKRIATQTDVDKTELQLLIRQDDLNDKETKLKELRSEIELVTGTDSAASVPAEPLNLKATLSESPQSVSSPLSELREVRIVTLSEEIAQNSAILAERSDDPSVNLLAGYTMDRSKRYGSEVNRNEILVGAQLEIPFFDTTTRADAAIKHIEAEKLTLLKKILLNSVQEKLENFKQRLIAQNKRIESSNKKVSLSKRILKNEEARFQTGRIDLDRLIDTENNFLTFQFQYQAELLEYNKTALSWLALVDQLTLMKEQF